MSLNPLFGFGQSRYFPVAMVGGRNLELAEFDTRVTGLHVSVHALDYATCAIEGMQKNRGVDGIWRINFPLEHHPRLVGSGIEIDILRDASELPQDEFMSALYETGIRNIPCLTPGMPGYLRPRVFEGSCESGVASGDGPIWMVTERQKDPYLGPRAETGITLWAPGPDAFCRTDKRCGFASVKCAANYVMGRKLKRRGKQLHDADEVLQFDLNGFVAEGTGQNIFIVVGDTIYTPKLNDAILPGITRGWTIKILRALGYRVIETKLMHQIFRQADEVFLTGTWSGIVPVRCVLFGATNPTPLFSKPMGRITRLVKQNYQWLITHDVDRLPSKLVIAPSDCLELRE